MKQPEGLCAVNPGTPHAHQARKPPLRKKKPALAFIPYSTRAGTCLWLFFFFAMSQSLSHVSPCLDIRTLHANYEHHIWQRRPDRHSPSRFAGTWLVTYPHGEEQTRGLLHLGLHRPALQLLQPLEEHLQVTRQSALRSLVLSPAVARRESQPHSWGIVTAHPQGLLCPLHIGL